MTIRRREALLFAAVLALGLWHLWHARFYEFFWDEDNNLAIGWLLSRGWRLYGDVFTHHMAVEYMPSTLLAGLFGNRFVCFRAFMLLLWASVSALVFLLTRRWAAGTSLAVAFAGLGSLWLTYWFGHMMLVESFWGYALLLALVLIGGPLGEGVEAGPWRSAAVGLLLAMAVSASLNCVLPGSCLLLWLACERRWRAQWRWSAAGAAGWLALAAVWCLRHADCSLLYDQAVRFNFSVYARYTGYGAGLSFLQVLRTTLAANARYFLALDVGGPSQYFESLLKLTVWAWLGARLWRRDFVRALWWLIFIPLLRVRGEAAPGTIPFHSAGYFLIAVFLLCRELSSVWAWAAGRRGLRWAVGLASAAVLAPTWLASAALVRSERSYPHGDPDCGAAIAAISRMTRPQDRIVVLPMAPRIYFETGRLPAVPNTCYLPWQADWPSQRAGTLAGLREDRPKVVVRQNEPVWRIPWTSYAADIEDVLEREYSPILLPGKNADEPYALLYLRKGR